MHALDIYHSPGSGSTWTPLAIGEVNDGVFSWSLSTVRGGVHQVKVVAKDTEGGVGEARSGLFTVVALASRIICAPNPVPSLGAVFFYTVPNGTRSASLQIFDAVGKLVFDAALDPLLNRFPAVGTWDSRDRLGRPLANGPYVYVLIADGRVIERGKLVIQR